MTHNHLLDAAVIAGSLQKSKRAGPGKYLACCPTHNDRTPSLSIKDAPNGKILVHCHAGCSQAEVIGALRNLGLWYEPSRQRIKYFKRQNLKEEIRRKEMLLALAASENEQGIVHSEFERAQIRRAIRFVERYGDG